MPTILRIKSFRFHFYSNESKEPPHIHVDTGDVECKFWLNPVKFVKEINVTNKQLNEIEKLIIEYQEFFMEKYNDFHK